MHLQMQLPIMSQNKQHQSSKWKVIHHTTVKRLDRVIYEEDLMGLSKMKSGGMDNVK